ncbi:phage baseplate plug family protein [Levilactobacillus andaensis]|uniref:phage baseplate plug family protein n=1 Tax=Levilactobacillus andaensis TaxID=2799570 RepID=UPI001942CF98|nr:hypothetical protein [Levilactobacillus andaensis]
MAEETRIDVDMSNLPQRFNMVIGGINYNFRLRHNDYNDGLYLDCWDEDFVPIVLGEKLEYGEPIFGSVNDPRLPLINWIPYSEDGSESTVTGGNLQKTVFIYAPEDDEDETDEAADQFGDDLDDDETEENVDDDLGDEDDSSLYGTDETVDGL